MMNWNNKIEVKKGNIGEDIAFEILANKSGYTVHKAINHASHKIDFLCYKNSDKKIIGSEIKTKKRRVINPTTGFNMNAHIEYIELMRENHIDIYIYFIDDFEECVYGNWLSVLIKKEHEIVNKGCYDAVVVWHLKDMIFERWLTDDELNEIKKYQNDNYDYSEINKYYKK